MQGKTYQTYTELIEALQTTKPNPVYWQTLFANSALIILQISVKGQHLVSKDLNMNKIRLSNIMPILREIVCTTE